MKWCLHPTPDLPSGSDRIYQALEKIDPAGKHQRIVNMQGDLPTLEPGLIARVLDVLGTHDMSTLIAEIVDDAERDDPNVVKAVMAMQTAQEGRALYFTRATRTNWPRTALPSYRHLCLSARGTCAVCCAAAIAAGTA